MSEKALRLPAIPTPQPDLQSLFEATTAIKIALETLIGSVGPKEQRAVTFVDLVNMGVILSDQIPEKFGVAPSGKVLNG